MNSREFQEHLAERGREAAVTIEQGLGLKLESYYRLLAGWNAKINLSGLDLSHPTPEALDRLLIEPVRAAQYAPAGVQRMVDIGSGGGSPAIPFALALGGPRLLMVESKTRKSVFLREAIRAVELRDGEVATARFEELVARPELHEAHDLLTIRAVRVEAGVLATLQAFVKPGGQLFLFRGAETGDGSEYGVAPLAWAGTHPLIEAMGSRLVVLEKGP